MLFVKKKRAFTFIWPGALLKLPISVAIHFLGSNMSRRFFFFKINATSYFHSVSEFPMFSIHGSHEERSGEKYGNRFSTCSSLI